MLTRPMLMSAVATLMLLSGCFASSGSTEPQEAEPSRAAVSGEESEQTAAPSTKAPRYCAVQLLIVSEGFVKDLKSSIDPKFVSMEGGREVIHIPGVLRTFVSPDGSEHIYMPQIFDISKHDASGFVASEMIASFQSWGTERSKPTKVAMTLLEAMSRVPEVPVDWSRVKRSTVGGRLSCARVTGYTNSPGYECEVSGIEGLYLRHESTFCP